MRVGSQAWGIFFTGHGIKILNGKIDSKSRGTFRLRTVEFGVLGLKPEFAFKSQEDAEVYLVMNS